MLKHLKKDHHMPLDGWLGRRHVGDKWHRMLQGGNTTPCGINDSFTAGPAIDDSFRSPARVRAMYRCERCEAIYKVRYGGTRSRYGHPKRISGNMGTP